MPGPHLSRKRTLAVHNRAAPVRPLQLCLPIYRFAPRRKPHRIFLSIIFYL